MQTLFNLPAFTDGFRLPDLMRLMGQAGDQQQALSGSQEAGEAQPPAGIPTGASAARSNTMLFDALVSCLRQHREATAAK